MSLSTKRISYMGLWRWQELDTLQISYLRSPRPLEALCYRIRCHTAAYKKATVLHPGIITACPDGHQSGIWTKLLCITMTALSTQAVGRPVLEEAFRTPDHCSPSRKSWWRSSTPFSMPNTARLRTVTVAVVHLAGDGLLRSETRAAFIVRHTQKCCWRYWEQRQPCAD